MMNFLLWLEGKSHSALWTKMIFFAGIAILASILAIYFGDQAGAKIKAGKAGIEAHVVSLPFLVVMFAAGVLAFIYWIKLGSYWEQDRKIQQRLSRYREPLPGRIVLD